MLSRRTPKRPEKQKLLDEDEDRWQPPEGSWNPDLPYGGKVKVARRKIPDPPWVKAIEAYAHIGHAEAQHKVGQRYLQGLGVDQNHKEAMKWFKRASKQGHAESSHNLAVGHLKGHAKLQRGEAKKLLKHAVKNGIHEAHHVLKECKKNKKCN